MRICLMHFASSLLRIFLASIYFLEFFYGILLVLSRRCFHHLVENSILYNKDIQHFYIGPILYTENKIIRSVVGGKVDGQILSGTRSEKPKILFGTRDEKRKNLFGTKWQFRKNLFGSQRVNKWLSYSQLYNYSVHGRHIVRHLVIRFVSNFYNSCALSLRTIQWKKRSPYINKWLSYNQL